MYEWTGVDFANSTRAAEHRTRRKEVVAKSFCGAPVTLQGYGID